MPNLDVIFTEQTADQAANAVEINNASVPKDQWTTEEQMRIADGLAPPNEPPLRLIGWWDGKPIARGYSGRSIFSREGRYRIDIQVVPEHRRRGVATDLYQRLLDFALGREARALQIEVGENCLPPLESWLARHGYEEIERMRPSELTLDDFDFESWAPADERITRQGLRLTTLAAEDTEANRRKLWDLSEIVVRDVPHPEERTAEFPFERFDSLLNRPEARPGCLVICKHREKYIGYTLLVPQHSTLALTGMTGVLPEYRNRGIALALKLRCVKLAKDEGYRTMRTFNHVNNPAMLKVNDRMGYIALPHQILFQRPIAEHDTAAISVSAR